MQSREETFLRACEFWNKADGSRRQRIGLTAKTAIHDIDIPKQLGLVLINDSDDDDQTDTEPRADYVDEKGDDDEAA